VIVAAKLLTVAPVLLRFLDRRRWLGRSRLVIMLRRKVPPSVVHHGDGVCESRGDEPIPQAPFPKFTPVVVVRRRGLGAPAAGTTVLPAATLCRLLARPLTTAVPTGRRIVALLELLAVAALIPIMILGSTALPRGCGVNIRTRACLRGGKAL
jgi:hypothetical protein